MATAQVNGTELWHEVEGEGTRCLTLHGGLGMDHTLFRPAFDDGLGDLVRLVYFDQRSNGRSGRPPIDTLTMEQLADDAAALAGTLGYTRVVVIGHSYGGFVAQELALRHPGLVAGLVLVCTTPGQLGASGEPQDQGPPPPPELQELAGEEPSSDDELKSLLRRMWPFYFYSDDEQAYADLPARTIFSVEASKRGGEVLSSWSSFDRLDQIAAPTLLVAGRQDVITSWQQSARIAQRVRRSELEIIDRCGHFPWIEKPERFFPIVRDWLDRWALT